MRNPPTRVLVVDDDPDMLSAIVATVEQLAGMDVLTAESAVDALDRLEGTDVDVVVSDYGMPDMTGVDLLTAIKSRFGEIPFVLLTGRGSEDVASAAIRAGVTDYVTKAEGWPERLAARLEDLRQFDTGDVLPDRQFRRMIQSRIAYGLYMLESGGRILTWNDGAASITGYSPAEMVGREYATLFSEDDVEMGVPEGLLETAVRSGATDYEGWRPTRDGEEIYVKEHLVSIEKDDGVSMLVGAILQDHTDQHRYERQLARQNDRLREFTSIISHDLRNPLSVVSGRIGLARETGEEEHLAAAEEAIERMESYVDDLLVLARQGRLVGQTELVDLAEAARDAWFVAQERDPDAVLELPGPPKRVSADRARFRELLENLFLNSVEHGSTGSRTQSGDSAEHGSTGSRALPDDAVEHGARRASARSAHGDSVEHGSTSDRPAAGDTGTDDSAGADAAPSVTVTVGPLEDGFYVTDDGPGFDEDDREHAFEHGFTTSEDGTGFGLSIVETICRAHGWDIQLVDGPGARFEVTGVGPSDHVYPVGDELSHRRSDGRSD